MPLIAIARSKFVKATEGTPETDWRTKNAKTRASLITTDLVLGLRSQYNTDAHLVCYTVRDKETLAPLASQPRVRKTAIDALDNWGFCVDSDVLMCDVDNPDHAAWTPETLEAARAEHSLTSDQTLASCGVYFTAHGRRLVQPLDEPIPVSEIERYISAWFWLLKNSGIEPDWACRDWTRMFRLPNVVRDGKPFTSPYVMLDGMRPVSLVPMAASIPRPKQ